LANIETMTNTQKTLLISALIVLVVWFLSKRKTKANTAATTNTSTPPTGHDAALFFNQNSDFENQVFIFSTPLGPFWIYQPDTSSTQFNQLGANESFNFGWQSPTPGVVVVTLLPKTQNAVVENAIINLEDQTIQFEYVQL